MQPGQSSQAYDVQMAAHNLIPGLAVQMDAELDKHASAANAD